MFAMYSMFSAVEITTLILPRPHAKNVCIMQAIFYVHGIRVLGLTRRNYMATYMPIRDTQSSRIICGPVPAGWRMQSVAIHGQGHF